MYCVLVYHDNSSLCRKAAINHLDSLSNDLIFEKNSEKHRISTVTLEIKKNLEGGLQFIFVLIIYVNRLYI